VAINSCIIRSLGVHALNATDVVTVTRHLVFWVEGTFIGPSR
jgi:hypothetical protein